MQKTQCDCDLFCLCCYSKSSQIHPVDIHAAGFDVKLLYCHYDSAHLNLSTNTVPVLISGQCYCKLEPVLSVSTAKGLALALKKLVQE